MKQTPPQCIMLAGPNGAGKSSIARTLLAETFGVTTFVNADVIAQGLSGFAPESAAWEASRVMLDRLHQLAASREDFAFETTLAARSYAGWIDELRQSGYWCVLNYVWLESADLAVARVQHRVAAGGHHIPEHTIRQRYRRSVSNFFELYRSRVDEWYAYDNSSPEQTAMIAEGAAGGSVIVHNPKRWQQMQEQVQND